MNKNVFGRAEPIFSVKSRENAEITDFFSQKYIKYLFVQLWKKVRGEPVHPAPVKML